MIKGLSILLNIIGVLMWVVGFLLLAQVIDYHLRHDYLTYMQLFKIFWYKYLISTVLLIGGVFFMHK